MVSNKLIGPKWKAFKAGVECIPSPGETFKVPRSKLSESDWLTHLQEFDWFNSYSEGSYKQARKKCLQLNPTELKHGQSKTSSRAKKTQSAKS